MTEDLIKEAKKKSSGNKLSKNERKKEFNEQLDQHDEKWADYKKRNDAYMKKFSKAVQDFNKGKDFKAMKVTERQYAKLMSQDPAIKALHKEGLQLTRESDALYREYYKILEDGQTQNGKKFVDQILDERYEARYGVKRRKY